MLCGVSFLGQAALATIQFEDGPAMQPFGILGLTDHVW